MAFVNPEKIKQRQSLLANLRTMVNEIDKDNCPEQQQCCPQSCCTPLICMPSCQPACASQNCSPAPQPCIPLCSPCQEEQTKLPCNPPQMMVAYRIPKGNRNGSELRKAKSRELRSSILHLGCQCEKCNGLQDGCPRSDCQGSPECMTEPSPTCGPSVHAREISTNYKKGSDLEQYQCYPAFVKLPECPPCCPPQCCPPPCGPSPCCPSPCCPTECSPACPPCCPPYCPPPCVPLIAQAPCPPPAAPGCPPCVPVGRVVPVAPATLVPIMYPQPCCSPPPCCPPPCCPSPCCPPTCAPCPPVACCPCPC